MILLFVVVWAIVIALNEVLFSAQPFTLSSLADAMPSTLMLSVFLSAAVYLAKKKIIDALKKGQPIDKRFVAELTPQVGHELNNMRRQMEGSEEPNANASSDFSAAKVRREHISSRRKFNPYTAAVEAASAPRNKARREAYQRAYENTTEDANFTKANEGLAILDALGEADRKAKESQSTAGAAVPLTPRKSSKSGAGVGSSGSSTSSTSSSSLSSASSSSSSSSSSSFSASTSAAANSLAGAGAADSSIAGAGADKGKGSTKTAAKSSVFPSFAERQAQKEQNKQRRQEQIDALSVVSQEDKAKAAAQSKKAASQAKAEDKSTAHTVHASGVNSVASNAHNSNAKASSESKGTEDKTLSSNARPVASSAEGKQGQDQDGAGIYQSKAATKQNSKVVRETRSATGKALHRTPTAARMSSFAERTAQQQHLASLQQEAQEQVPLSALKRHDGSKPSSSAFMPRNSALMPSHTKLDTSALQRSRQPKQGAGLDTSALKRATLSPSAQADMNSAINPFIPPTYNDSANLVGGFNVGGRLLNSSYQDHLGAGNSMLQRTGEVGVNAPQQGANNISPWTSAAAMNTTMNNDSSMARGQVQRLDLADFQANARARALARAQAPKTTIGSVAASRLSPSALNRRNRRKDLTSNVAAQGTRGLVGSSTGGMDNQTSRFIGASTLGLNNARTALPRESIPSDQAPVRRVITTSLKPQVGPHSDHLPKVRPSDVIGDLQLSPKVKARARGNSANLRRNRDQLLQRGPNFINAAATTAATGSVGAVSSEPMTSSNAETNVQTDKIHAHRNIGTYNRMQKSATTKDAASTTYSDDDEENQKSQSPEIKSSDDKKS